MKKLIILLSVLLLLGCSDDGPVSKRNEVIDKANDVLEETDKNNDNVLTEVGQKIEDDRIGATVELMAIKEVNETIDLNPIKLTIDDIKIIKMSNIKNSELKETIQDIVNKDEVNYIQIMYTLENTSEKNVELVFPIEYIVLNTGEQIDVVENDLMNDNNNGGDFYGQVTKQTGISAIIKKSNVEDIETIKLITGEVWEINGDYLVGEIEKTYELN